MHALEQARAQAAAAQARVDHVQVDLRRLTASPRSTAEQVMADLRAGQTEAQSALTLRESAT